MVYPALKREHFGCQVGLGPVKLSSLLPHVDAEPTNTVSVTSDTDIPNLKSEVQYLNDEKKMLHLTFF